MKLRAFNAKLIGNGSGCFVLLPYDVEKEYGKKNLIPVKVTFDGEPYRGSIANMGKGPCLVVLKAIREKIGRVAGDIVEVTVPLDTEPRKVEVPLDVSALFKKHPEQKVFYETLAYTHKKEYMQWVTGAKKAETRAARLEKLLVLLKAKQKTL